MSEVVVDYLDGVKDDDLFCCGIDGLEAVVVLECRAGCLLFVVDCCGGVLDGAG